MKFSGMVWSDHGTTLLYFSSIGVNRSASQRSICLSSPAIAQRTGVNKSVAFAKWQQGAGFVVPRTTACSLSATAYFDGYDVNINATLLIRSLPELSSSRCLAGSVVC